MVIVVVMVVMVIRSDRTTRTHRTGQKSQGGETGPTDLTFKLDFPGNLCRAAFAIHAMFLSQFRKGVRQEF